MEIIKTAINNYFSALEKLKELKIILNSKDFTGQIGEWLASIVYNGTRSDNGIQKDWDIISEGKYYQVKSSAKSKSTTARWSKIEYSDTAKIDFLIIIVFSEKYELLEFYEIPWEKAKPKIKITGKKKADSTINWRDVTDYKLDLQELKRKNDVLSVFIK